VGIDENAFSATKPIGSYFTRPLGEARERTGWKVHAWMLMSNHYHLMVQTPEANLVAGNEMAAEHLRSAA